LESKLPAVMAYLGAQSAQLVQLDANDPTVTLFTRHPFNGSLPLYYVLNTPAFTSQSGYDTLALGLNLSGAPQLHDLAAHPHLLVVGGSAGHLDMLMSAAINLMLFNSPGYVRLALVGDATGPWHNLRESPHVLGEIITQVHGFRRLLDGLLKHISTRARLFRKHSAKTLADYNKLSLSDSKLVTLPRLVILLDAAGLPGWAEMNDKWLVPLYQLLGKGPEVGVHVLMAVPQADDRHLPARLRDHLKTQFTQRAALIESGAQDAFSDQTPVHFVDGLFGNIPLEVATVSDSEITSAVAYWQNMRMRRDAEKQSKGAAPSTGHTGLLNLREDMLPDAPTQPVAPEEPAAPAEAEHEDDVPVISDEMVASAQALAGYLGWLSPGPLRDVLRLTPAETDETLRILRALGVLEDGEGPLWRFVRLADPPAGTFGE
ncbi:MAG: FtsK/SpoIIIE domain-containing protein, partial [Anaerolineales bacterium]